jgi:hypothetical protein
VQLSLSDAEFGALVPHEERVGLLVSTVNWAQQGAVLFEETATADDQIEAFRCRPTRLNQKKGRNSTAAPLRRPLLLAPLRRRQFFDREAEQYYSPPSSASSAPPHTRPDTDQTEASSAQDAVEHLRSAAACHETVVPVLHY